jgi:hypothetical protein
MMMKTHMQARRFHLTPLGFELARMRYIRNNAIFNMQMLTKQIVLLYSLLLWYLRRVLRRNASVQEAKYSFYQVYK